jgi:D-inositol-3-phosphate glycosyltransferase
MESIFHISSFIFINNRLAIVTQDPANYGGVLRLVEYIYRRAEAAGLEPVILHYARFENHPELHASILNLTHGELNLWPTRKDYIFNGMRAVAIGAMLPEWEPNRLHSNRLWRRALAEFDRFILVTGSAQTGLPLAELKKSFQVWASSTVETDRRERLLRSTGIANWIEKAGLPKVLAAEKKVLQAASSVMAVSNDARKHLMPVAGREVSVWPYPVDTQKFNRVVGGDSATHRGAAVGAHHACADSRFLFVGRANDPRKRIELFFRACEALRKESPSLDFVATVVSSEIPIPQNPSFKIETFTNLSDEELIQLYQNSSAFVLTSEQEGLGIAAMEAMACGLPVISTPCGGPETFIEDSITGFFVDDEAEAIADRMHELATDDALRMRLGNSAQEKIEAEFSERVWNGRFEGMLKIK